jgi:hypothetical protein
VRACRGEAVFQVPYLGLCQLLPVTVVERRSIADLDLQPCRMANVCVILPVSNQSLERQPETL